MRPTTPFDFWLMGVEIARIGFESQAVITMRTLGIVGLWDTGQGETTRMVAEKPVTLTLAWMAGMRAAMNGATPDKVVTATLRPIGRKTRLNHRRLSRGGPKFG